MRNYILLFTIVTLISCSTSNFIPSNIDKDHLDVRHQIINLKIYPEEYVIGETTLFLTLLTPRQNIVIDVAAMEILAVKLNGNPVDFKFVDDQELLLIESDRITQLNTEQILKIKYKSTYKNLSDPSNIWGSFGKGIRYFQPTITEKERRIQVWATGEAENSKYWFPCNNNLTDLRTTEITISAPFKTITNGKLIRNDTSSNEVVVSYKEDIPYPSHQTFFVCGDYHNYQQRFEDVVINNYGYPDEKIGTMESVVSLPNMMQFFSEYTDCKYPYSTYTQIFVQDFAGWKPGLASSIITENMIDDKTTHKDFLYLWDLTEGEALAAQWFGNYIKPKSWSDAWLSKGFARYFSGVYSQFAKGNTEFLTYRHAPDLLAYLNDWNRGLETTIVPNTIEDIDLFVNGSTPNAKASRVLHMLRKEIGEDKWKQLIKEYTKAYGNKLVSTSNFLQIANNVVGRSLHWFFDQWFFGVGHPIFEISQQYDDQANLLTLVVTQNQNVDSLIRNRSIPFFKGKMYIEIDDKIVAIDIRDKRKNTYTFSLKERPKLVNFDFEDTWIKESTFKKTSESLLEELSISKDPLHQVTVMQELANRIVSGKEDSEIVSFTLETLRSKALHEKYWRMRLIAISQLSQILSNTSMTDGVLVLDQKTEEVLLTLVNREKSWVKAWAINLLGLTCDRKYVPFYLNGLKDYSDRVVFRSAIALGKSKDPIALETLLKLPEKPSWKNQSLISALYGLKELRDPQCYQFAIQALTDSEKPHWNLGTPRWDHRLAAANTLVALGKVNEGYDKIYEQFENALQTGNMNDIFFNTQLIAVLGDPRGDEVFKQLKIKFRNDKNALSAIDNYENTYKSAINN